MPNDAAGAAPAATWSQRFSTVAAMFVTILIFVLFFACLAVAYWWEDKQSFNGLVETVKNLTMVAVGYWLGSSLGSKTQSEVIAAKLAQPDAPPKLDPAA
jgi:uncharacterized membrane protein YfcA